MPDSSTDALQRLTEIGGWVDTLARDQESKTRSILVFDTDVLTMYIRPHAAANYCATMRSESSARAAGRGAPDAFSDGELLLADMLGIYLVWGRPDAALNAAAHADELADACETAFTGALARLEEGQQVLSDGLRDIARNHEASSSPDTVRAEELQRALNALLDQLWLSAAPVVQAIRLNAAFQAERIHSVDAYRVDAGLSAAAFLPSPYERDSGDFNPDIRAIAREIEKLLVAGATFGELKHKRMRDDATAIAHICWLNTQLAGIQSPVRVRLVTGTSYIHRLCTLPHDVFARLPQPLRDVWAAMHSRFLESIRHPLALIDEDGFRELLDFDGIATVGGRLGDWLRGRLPEAEGSADDTTPASEASGAGGRAGEAPTTHHARAHQRVEEAARELASVLRVARARQMLSPEHSWLADIAQEAIGLRSSDWGALMQERLQQLLPQFLASLATIQRPQSTRSASVARNLPPLVLANFPECQAFCDRLYSNGTTRLASHDAKTSLTRMISSDPSLYTPLLSVALWRAAERDWVKAGDMAAAAAMIAARIRGARPVDGGSGSPREGQITAPIFGEEALFLLAVATRVTAGLKKADDFVAELDRAMASVRDATAQLTAANGGAVQPDDPRLLRHRAEEFSNRVARLLQAKLSGRVEARGTFQNTQSAELSLFLETQETLATAVAALALVSDRDSGTYLLEYVAQELCGTAAQLVLLDRYAVAGLEVFPLVARTWSEGEAHRSQVAFVHDVFGQQCRRLAQRGSRSGALRPAVSTLTSTIWTAFDLEFTRKLGAGARHQLRSDLESWTDRANWTAGIDELRINFLKKIAYRKIGYT